MFHLVYANRINGKSMRKTAYFGTLLQAVAQWSLLKERDMVKDIDFAYITHYTDEGHPGVMLMDLNFNPFADSCGAFLDLK